GFADGTGTSAQFNLPTGVAVSPDGLTVYVADKDNHRIRKVSADGTVTTLAGSTTGFADGTGASAQFSFPTGVSVSPDGTTVYVADSGNDRIRKITLGTTSVETGEQSATAWILSPNPASGTLRITAPETTTETNFTMYDYLGTTVLSGKVEQSRELDISALAMGIYYIRFGATAPMKFIKQ
ncbi:MAG: T9SS type A sorting domain-containing protein, partial [Candidatus Kapabacteria bacterium]|nr:T9SS type A sorting domain-containing protein [Candidatus Kapabacteria bacterium]